MDLPVLPTATISLYLVAVLIQVIGIQRRWRWSKNCLFSMGLIAVCLHALLLHAWVDVGNGQNLDLLNLVSLSLWLITIFVLMLLLFRPLEILALIVFPLAALSILFVQWFPGQAIINAAASSGSLFHIILSIVTFCVLSLAALLALLLALEQWLLHGKHYGVVLQKLPPIETMETLMFQVISLGFILLSVVVVTSWYFYHALIWQQKMLMHKAIFSVAAWFVFAILLIGRQRWGWRGRRAIYSTLVGVILLVIAYLFIVGLR